MNTIAPNISAAPGGRSRLRASSVRLARRLIDGCAERYLRIRTTGSTKDRGSGHHRDSNQYEPLDYPFLLKCLAALDLREDDVVFEIGCGMGRVLSILARRRIRKCIGVELCENLADRARANLATLRGRRAPVEVLTADAAFVDYSEGTVFYIFNSFGPTTWQAVLERIRAGVAQNPRTIRLIYVNPIHQDVLEASGWLRLTRHVGASWCRMRATCWTNEPAGA